MEIVRVIYHHKATAGGPSRLMSRAGLLPATATRRGAGLQPPGAPLCSCEGIDAFERFSKCG